MPGEGALDRREVEEVRVDHLAQLRVLLAGRSAPDREHALHMRIEQALAQHALPDHPGGSEEKYFHGQWSPRYHGAFRELLGPARLVGPRVGKPLTRRPPLTLVKGTLNMVPGSMSC
jgi:hypothetical protein